MARLGHKCSSIRTDSTGLDQLVQKLAGQLGSSNLMKLPDHRVRPIDRTGPNKSYNPKGSKT